MGVYKLSRKAEMDLAGMYEDGIYKFGLLQAQNYYLEMHKVLGTLADNINLGRDASEFIEELKKFTFKAHTIFYLPSASGVLVVRVLYQRMDYGSNLSKI